MKVSTHDGAAQADAVVSIGMFDGVHRGHAKVLRHLRDRGAQLGIPTTVVTFDPHPLAVLRPDACPALLSTLSDRIALLGSTGAVDHCVVLRFDHERSRHSADDFVQHTLLARLGMRELIVGENFACGRDRIGTVPYLSALGRSLGFRVAPVPLDALPGTLQAVRSSSTEVRRLIQLGDLAGASSVLQRPHEMTCTIMHSAVSARQVEASLESAMCAPAEADYVGAVRCSNSLEKWIPALLQVRGECGSGRRIVRLLAENKVDGSPGDELRIRFLDRVRTGASARARHGVAA